MVVMWKDLKLMGRIAVPITLSNNADRILAERGMLPPDRVRRMTIAGLVDTGATRLVIPELVAIKLGFPAAGETQVRYGDNSTAKKALVDQVHVELMGRDSVFKALVEPGRVDALIGAIVMEDLDLLIDCSALKLYPRDPDTYITEVE